MKKLMFLILLLTISVKAQEKYHYNRTTFLQIERDLPASPENQKSIYASLNQQLANELDSVLIFFDSAYSCHIVIGKPNYGRKNNTYFGEVFYKLNYFNSESSIKEKWLSDFSNSELLDELKRRDKLITTKQDYDQIKFQEAFDQEMKKLENENKSADDKDKALKVEKKKRH
jgi:hypothetical protein